MPTVSKQRHYAADIDKIEFDFLASVDEAVDGTERSAPLMSKTRTVATSVYTVRIANIFYRRSHTLKCQFLGDRYK